ncbi:MAG: hypothetical protein MJ071_01465 [Oscillospiraceae bacterium]|nr:hypothetical protein [Oscillospiraceae bacterium]
MLNRKQFLFVTFAAFTAVSCITACGGKSQLDELSGLEVNPAATLSPDQLIEETTQSQKYELTAVTTQTEPIVTGEPGVDYKGNFAGKWELTEWNNTAQLAGQYGTDNYRVIYQMQLNANGTCVFYDRCNGVASAGTWDGLNENLALIQFPNYTQETMFSTLNLELDDGKLTQQSMAMIFSSVSSFTQPARPSVYAVAGDWVCDTIIDSAEGMTYTDSFRDIPVESFNTSIYSIEQTAVINCQGTQFTASDDGTGCLTAYCESSPEHGWNGSRIWINGSSLIWEVQEPDGISQLVFHHRES